MGKIVDFASIGSEWNSELGKIVILEQLGIDDKTRMSVELIGIRN